LVLGDDTRSFLAIVRSLGRRGIVMHAAPRNFRSPSLRSRYIAAVHDIPPWMTDGSDWLNSIEALLRAERYDMVIPCNETALLPLQHHRTELSRLTRLAIPADPAIAVLFDKHRTRDLARQLGVPVAAGRLVRADDIPEKLLTEFGAPVVVKPRRSYQLDRLGARGKVRVTEHTGHLGQLLKEAAPGGLVVERYFAGQGIGISVLASRGRVLQAFEHHRVREIAGASFYRCSAPLTVDLVEACEAIVGALDYTGLAMFEFKVGADGKRVLLEINARPWGSMPLPVALGIDFPYRWYQLLKAGEETPPVPYRIGVYGRNFFEDLRLSLVEANSRQLGSLSTSLLIIRRTAEMWRFLMGREVNDVLVRDDPRPALSELRDAMRVLSGRVARVLPGADGRRCRLARSKVVALRTAADPSIIFVCQGNICRSPFAEALLRAQLRNTAVAIGSAGMIPQPDRATPALGVKAAAVHGVNLSAHRSTWLTRPMVRAASLLIVFDEITRSTVMDRYPDLTAPVVLLGDLAVLGQIADPIDGDADEFSRVYAQIATAVVELTSLLRTEKA
jgi:protein-tyrosine-phosphatase/predicted ATP-grasp superfamily ATP-dependent carboligase